MEGTGMPRKLPELELTVEEITPVIAKEWLQFNTFNRKVSRSLVQSYAQIMKDREWRLNGEAIIFDRTGRLQSGQHRLLAVIESGTSIWSVVVRGAEPEAIFSLDAGRKRRLTDALTLRGEKDVSNLATATTWWWRYQNDLMESGGITSTAMHLV